MSNSDPGTRTEEILYKRLPAGRLQLIAASDLLCIDVRSGFRAAVISGCAPRLAASQRSLDPMSIALIHFIARLRVQDGRGELSAWRCALYAWMTWLAEGAAAYSLPPARQSCRWSSVRRCCCSRWLNKSRRREGGPPPASATRGTQTDLFSASLA